MELEHLKEAIGTLAEDVHGLKKEMKENIQAKKGRPEVSSLRACAPLSTKTDQVYGEENKEFSLFLRKGNSQALSLKSLSSTTGGDGGYMIPQSLSSTIIKVLDNLSPLRQLASVTTVSTDSLDFLIDREAFSAGWASELDDRDETDAAKIGKIKIDVHEMYAKPKATQKLLDDAAVDVEKWLVGKVSDKLAALENQAFLMGDGVGKPKGILSYELANQDEWVWGKFEQIKTGTDGAFLDDGGSDVLIRTVERLKSVYHMGACWVMSPSALSAIRCLKDQQGFYLWQQGLEAGKPGTLLGFPVHVCEDMPMLEAGRSSTSVIFGNFKQAYQIVDRKSLGIMRDPFSSKPFVEFYATKRVGGAVVNFEALKMVRFEA